MLARILLSCLCSLMLCLAAKAQEIYPFDTRYPVHAIDSFLQVYPDTSGQLQAQQILQDTTSPFLLVKDFPRYLDIQTVYWGKLKIKSTEAVEDWKLHLQDRYFGSIAWVIGNDKVDLYAYQADELLYHYRSGNAYKRSEKEISDFYNLNQLPFELPADEVVTLLIRVENKSRGIPPFFNLHIRKNGYEHYHPYSESRAFFNTFNLGVFFIVFIYHLLQFLYTRQSIFLWFSLWLLICTLTQAMVATYTSEFLLGNIPNARFPIWNFISNGILFTFWFFGRSFIESKKKFPRIDKAILILTALIALEIVGNTVYLLFWDPPVYFGAMGIHYEMIGIFSLVGLLLAVVITLQKDRFATYFGIAAITGTFFTLLGSLWSLRIVPLQFDPYATAVFLQVIAYSFGIAYRQQQINQTAQAERLEAEKSKAEAQRVKDLDQVKTRFFANISHEFRTPLTLIKGLMQKALKSQENSASDPTNDKLILQTKDVSIVEKNAVRLEHLVDQLLDLSRIESGQTLLQLRKGSLISFVRAIVFSFESLAEQKNISLNTSFPEELPYAYYDEDKLEKIISNLLSNALKYTPASGVVNFSIEYTNRHFTMLVSDTGEGMEKEEVKRIFERFYRIEGTEEKGSGIGLALTKELVDLHQGHVNVSSVKGEGTTFKIKIPYHPEDLPDSMLLPDRNAIPADRSNTAQSYTEDSTPVASEIPAASSNQDLAIALVVEDNPDLRYFIKDILHGHFEIITAVDGEQGERLAFEHIPDIIISDVMMPKKDGYEMANALKTNTKTSHIPIIMLTAKAGHLNKMEGLTQGVDAYLTKPFDGEELLLRMRNLIETRKKIWERFKASDLVLVPTLPANSADDEFLQAVAKVIKSNLDNERLSVEDLARTVGFSRSQLHRKLKALTNQSANQLITDIRLNEARRMLESKQGSVSEVAYSVGYSNMSYFTKSFKAKFGVLPSRV